MSREIPFPLIQKQAIPIPLTNRKVSLEEIDAGWEPLCYLVAVSNKTGKETLLTSPPVARKEAETIMGKLSQHAQRSIQIREVT